MEKIDNFEFQCIQENCRGSIHFSLFDWEKTEIIACPECGKKYKLNQQLRKQLKQFHDLILAVREAKDIIGNINVGIAFHGHTCTIPYALLLTRLNPTLTLSINGKEIHFRFRVEPLDDEDDQIEQM